jgi:hypothetical protein
MGATYSMHGEMRYMYRIFVGKPEGKRPLGRPRNSGRIILDWILGEQSGRCVLDSSG